MSNPTAGKTLPISTASRKSATNASRGGNICANRMNSRPPRRPLNRCLENAYAPSAHRKTIVTDAPPAIRIVFHSQRKKSVSLNRVRKLTSEGFAGMRRCAEMEPVGLIAAETM